MRLCFSRSGDEVEYFEEFPVYLIHRLPDITGRPFDEVIVLNLQYGANFSGPGKYVFSMDRATGEASDAHNSNFLHPVFYHYKKLPTGKTCRYSSRIFSLNYCCLQWSQNYHEYKKRAKCFWNVIQNYLLESWIPRLFSPFRKHDSDDTRW